jgi:hypothetical protein
MTMNQFQVKKANYKGWPNCYSLSNRLVDLVVTADVGPRIIRFGFIDRDNELKEIEETLGQTGGNQWRIYGGHRLWHAPEEMPRTYAPDNDPVAVQEGDGFLRLVQTPEPATGIQKEMDLSLDPGQAKAILTHRLRNTGLWAVELAPWALTIMAPGGVAIFPLPPRGSHSENLRPTGALTLWAYTDMADPRWTWGKQYILLRQDPQAITPQKIGAWTPDGWVAYARQDHLFVKTFALQPEAIYPDRNSPLELFTDSQILEVETLGPLVRLEPGAAVEHTEEWFLYDGVPAPQNDDDVKAHILPRVVESGR